MISSGKKFLPPKFLHKRSHPPPPPSLRNEMVGPKFFLNLLPVEQFVSDPFDIVVLGHGAHNESCFVPL